MTGLTLHDLANDVALAIRSSSKGSVVLLGHAFGNLLVRTVPIDLTEVLLVDRERVRLFATSELKGIELRNCPAYIREWVTKEKESK